MRKIKKITSIILAMALSASLTTAFAFDTDESVSLSQEEQTIVNDDVKVVIDEIVLTKDVDYTLTYKDNVDIGTATVTVHFIGNYEGTAEKTFEIKKKSSSGGGGGGGGTTVTRTVDVVVTDKDNNKITVITSEKDGVVTVTLPTGKKIKDNEYTVTVTDKKTKNPVEGKEVLLKDRYQTETSGKTDKDGKVVLPVAEATPTPVPDTDTSTDKNTHTAYISGYEGGTFKPDENISRSETAAIIYRTLNERYSDEFEAVQSATQKYFEEKLASNELNEENVTGMVSNMFSVANGESDEISPELMNMLSDFHKIIEDNTPFTVIENVYFPDLVEGAWYEESILALASLDIIHGYDDGNYNPDSPITRAEFTTMLMQNMDIQNFDEADNPFPDLKDSHYAADYIYTAYKLGIINGYEDGTFKPDSPITRAEAVTILNGVLGRTDLPNDILPFSDVSMNHWAYRQIVEASVTHKKTN